MWPKICSYDSKTDSWKRYIDLDISEIMRQDIPQLYSKNKGTKYNSPI